MSDLVRIELLPLRKTLTVERGSPLQELLFAEGVEFPCGGKGRCKGCKIKVLSGSVPVSAEDTRCLTAAEVAQGWRLACRAQVTGDITIDLAQWEAPILADDSRFEFTPREGLGVAVDLGTTTVVAQLLDLRTGQVLAVRTALNAQAQFGADIMSRVEFALQEEGRLRLSNLVRSQLAGMIREMLAASNRQAAEIADVAVVGNTVMHHLFCALDVKELAHFPFEASNDGLHSFNPSDLGWHFLPTAVSAPLPSIRFLPCLGGFVGSDLLAGLLSTKLHASDSLVALIDLGTNGEIVVGNRDRILCASTAAGPAFEGARISMGMRAATGAISEVHRNDDQLQCHVLGNVAPRGICGSGLVDAVAVALDLGWIKPDGRLNNRATLELAPPVQLTQGDIRELQLAKGAIAAGVRILVQKWGASLNDLSRVYLAGAFGNYINRASAQRIGLIDFPRDKVTAAGNTALLGAKLALSSAPFDDGSFSDVLARVEHVSINEDPQFHEIYVDEMRFPDSAPEPGGK